MLQVSDALRAGRVTSVELVNLSLARIDACKALRAFVSTGERDQLLTAAKASDARRASGRARPLEGIPIAAKDNFCHAGTRTTAGSKMLHSMSRAAAAAAAAAMLRCPSLSVRFSVRRFCTELFECRDAAAGGCGRRSAHRQNEFGRIRYGQCH